MLQNMQRYANGERLNGKAYENLAKFSHEGMKLTKAGLGDLLRNRKVLS